MLGGKVHPPALASGAVQLARPQPPTQGHTPQEQVGFILGLALHKPTCAPGHRRKDLLFPEDKKRLGSGHQPWDSRAIRLLPFLSGTGGSPDFWNLLWDESKRDLGDSGAGPHCRTTVKGVRGSQRGLWRSPSASRLAFR